MVALTSSTVVALGQGSHNHLVLRLINTDGRFSTTTTCSGFIFCLLLFPLPMQMVEDFVVRGLLALSVELVGLVCPFLLGCLGTHFVSLWVLSFKV